MSNEIKIPLSAADDPESDIKDIIPDYGDAYIPNLCKGKEYLTVFEALEQITRLSGFLMADNYRREDDRRRSIGKKSC